MTFIEWKDEFSVGHIGCDEDHQRLIGIINRLEEITAQDGIDNSDFGWVIGELSDYVKIHFMREESLLEQVDYSELAEHRLEHVNFAKWLDDIKKRYKSNDRLDTDFARNLNSFLRDWMVNHILHSDMKYKGEIT